MENSFRHWLDLISLLVKRDLKVRYRASILGYLWSMVNPLLMMSILSVVFSFAMRSEIEHYQIYILSGLVGWNIFAQSLHLGVRCFTDNATLMKKVKIPAWVFPTSIIVSACFHASVALIPYFLISIFMGLDFGWPILQFPIVFILYFFFIEGLVLFLGSLHVFFRDIGHIIEPSLQILFYATPIIYPLSVVPEKWRLYLYLNPMSHFIEGFRSCLYKFQIVSFMDWSWMLGCALISFAAGILTFTKTRKRFLYHI